MSSTIILAAATALTLGQAAPQPLPSVSSTTAYHRVDVDGVGIFYREAGLRDAPTVLLLHGYPSSSRQYEVLLPLLADRYHVIAPDYPGFGQSDAPPPSRYAYTFDRLARTMEGLVERRHLLRQRIREALDGVFRGRVIARSSSRTTAALSVSAWPWPIPSG